ncbi:MAG: 4Fe-4S binding protein [Kiritimatiellaeota bacterium]|nr:4Fe-4S binding protein [Kiritimatiellota bacterium]
MDAVRPPARRARAAKRRGPSRLGTTLGALAMLAVGARTQAIGRFPPPDFDSGYALPRTQWPAPRAEWLGVLDVTVLAVGLCLAVYLALVRRSRRGILWLSIACLAYLGFYRKGCVCPIGAIQNAALAFADPTYAISTGIILFLVLPLLFALWAGRVFCGGVCPLGAIQDVVLVRPVRVPVPLAAALTFLPWAYLGLAVTAVVTRGDFLICRYDPFVAFFRRSGSATMLGAGGALLLLAVVVGRPYCRFLCPYGILLGLFSRASRHRISVTPDVCIRCGLCHDACPFDAIRPPETREKKQRGRSGSVRFFTLALPVLAAAAGFGLGPLLAPRGTFPGAVAALGAGLGKSGTFRTAGALLGLFLGGVLLTKILCRLRPENREDYEAVPSECVACGRCFAVCPRERFRRGEVGMPDDAGDGPTSIAPAVVEQPRDTGNDCPNLMNS